MACKSVAETRQGVAVGRSTHWRWVRERLTAALLPLILIIWSWIVFVCLFLEIEGVVSKLCAITFKYVHICRFCRHSVVCLFLTALDVGVSGVVHVSSTSSLLEGQTHDDEPTEETEEYKEHQQTYPEVSIGETVVIEYSLADLFTECGAVFRELGQHECHEAIADRRDVLKPR